MLPGCPYQPLAFVECNGLLRQRKEEGLYTGEGGKKPDIGRSRVKLHHMITGAQKSPHLSICKLESQGR